MVKSENSRLQNSGIGYNGRINQATWLVRLEATSFHPHKTNEDQTMKTFKLKSSAQRQAKKDGIDKVHWGKCIKEVDGKWVLYTLEEVARLEAESEAFKQAMTGSKIARPAKAEATKARAEARAKARVKAEAKKVSRLAKAKAEAKPKPARPAGTYVGTGVRGLTYGAARIAIEKPIGEFVKGLILDGLANKEIYDEIVRVYGEDYAAGKKWYAGWYRHDMKKRGLI